ncbi:hypothetical protein Tco_1540246 [Tanacetum coccineum]
MKQRDSSRTGSSPSGRVDLAGDEDPTDEDGDTRVSDSEVSVSLGEISSRGKKSQESNIGDIEDGGKAVGEKTSVAKRYLVKSSEELGEMFPDPITPPAVLTPSPVLPPSLLFDPRYFFVPEELLPPKKQIHSPSSSSTTLSNSSRNQTCDLVSPSFSVYTPTPPQIFEIGKSSIKMHLKHHEEQIEDILNYLDELSFHHIEKMEEGRINRMIIRRNGNELKTELKRIRTQIIKLHKKQLGQKDKIAFAHYRISNLEQIIEEIQARHQTNQEDL